MNALGIGLWIVMVSPATLEEMIGLMNENSMDVYHFLQKALFSVLKSAHLQ